MAKKASVKRKKAAATMKKAVMKQRAKVVARRKSSAPVVAAPAHPADALTAIWRAGTLRGGGPSDCWSLEGPGYAAAAKKGKKPLHLAYFAIRALGELQKLILEYSGKPYKCDVYLSGPNGPFAAIKPSLPFGRLPALYDFDGKGNTLTQSDAIVRLVARKCGMAGGTASEEAMVDMLYMQWKDCCTGTGAYSVEALKGGGSLKDVPEWRAVARANSLTPFQISVAGLRVFEDLLVNSDSGFLVGKKATFVDLALWTTLFELDEVDKFPQWAAKLRLPALEAFKAKVETKRLISYLKSDRRMPRMGEGYTFVRGRYSEARNAA